MSLLWNVVPKFMEIVRRERGPRSGLFSEPTQVHFSEEIAEAPICKSARRRLTLRICEWRALSHQVLGAKRNEATHKCLSSCRGTNVARER